MSELVRLTDVTKVYQGGITGALNGGKHLAVDEVENVDEYQQREGKSCAGYDAVSGGGVRTQPLPVLARTP